MLLQDEKNVLEWLSEYGPLLEEQVICLLHDKNRIVAEKIIRNLVRENRIVRLDGGYLSLIPAGIPDHRIVDAVWVLTRFIHRINPLAHYQAKYPSQLIFLSKDSVYEVIVLETDEDRRILRLLKPDENTKFIIAIREATLMDNRYAPEGPCLYALLSCKEGNIPHIEFYQGGQDYGKAI